MTRTVVAAEDYGQTASLGTLRDATTQHGRLPVLACNGYDDAAAALAGMVTTGDVVVSFGTGSPYLVLDRLASSPGWAAS
jgi:glycerol kinase